MNQAALLMDGGFSCLRDPNAANLVYWFRANGLAGAHPTTSDGGATFTWHYRDSTKAALSSASKYWEDYDTSMFFNGNGIICDPSVGDSNFPFRLFADGAASWSHMMRIIPGYTESGVQLKNIGINNSDWGTSDMMYSVGLNYDTPTGKLRVGTSWNDGTGTSGGGWGVQGINSSILVPQTTPMEILITRDGPSKTTYMLVNGTLAGSFVGSPRSAAYDPATMKVATAGSANAGANAYAPVFYLNDEYLWNTCIATASYTPKTQPFC
ncbi:hypothetical protein [Azospirillum sp. Sh1]|uniref:hypothetical protein n=1 Tax=Azospirillum sp. Sh1 TaxID=2607285 RepID=UPI0011ECF794|nr:hypothetical protein [Azospirillum sp. Sh1]KAA0571066.1 hypothetical protein FZ029_27830 [Azospirillum sp. Sh1]